MHDSFNSCLLYILGFDNTASPLSKMTVVFILKCARIVINKSLAHCFFTVVNFRRNNDALALRGLLECPDSVVARDRHRRKHGLEMKPQLDDRAGSLHC